MSSRFGTRYDRANALAAKGEIVRSGNAWLVPSQNSDAVYRVTSDETGIHCTCEDHKRNRNFCKHCMAASLVAQREMSPA